MIQNMVPGGDQGGFWEVFWIQNTDFCILFFDSAIDFKDAGGPPMLTGPLPDP